MNTTELFLVAMLGVFSLPYLVWRLGRTEYWAPLVRRADRAGSLRLGADWSGLHFMVGAFLGGAVMDPHWFVRIIFANVLLDKQIITPSTFTALLLMAVGSTMLTVPVVTPMLARLKVLLGKTG